jgi:flagellar hook-associated protein 1 FlgK
MNSTFNGLNIAGRGIYASQAAISVVTNNMSNVNTNGYSRQTVNQVPVGVAAVYGGRSLLGNGTEVSSVRQLRDPRLDQRYWQENARLGGWDTKAGALTEMESVLNLVSAGSGFGKVFDHFYAALEGLAKGPGAATSRNTVREAGKAVCQYLHETAQQLAAIREDKNCAVKMTVDEMNSYAGQIAALNDRITSAEASGANANQLKDQRNVLLDELSKLADITVTGNNGDEQAAGSGTAGLTVSVNGMTLVNGGDAKKLAVIPNSGGAGMYGVVWEETGTTFSADGGNLKSLLDLRDGDGVNVAYKGVPYYSKQLDIYAQTFAKAFNEGVFTGASEPAYPGHAGGFLADGKATGIRFFSYEGASSAELKTQIGVQGVDAVYQKITAANISLSKDIEESVNNIAAASSSGGADNGENISQLLKLMKDSDMFNKGTPQDFYNSIISTLGTDSAAAQRCADNAAGLTKAIQDRRLSIGGVDINEETANLTKYQQAYEANSKIAGIWNQIYEKTIDMVNS